MADVQVRKFANAEDEVKKYPDVKMEHLEVLRDWAKKQPHFPKFDDDILLLQFLRRCRGSIEKAKVKLDNYLTFCTHFPEACTGRTVDQPDMKNVLAEWQHVILPKRDRNGNIVMIIRTLTSDATRYSPDTTLKIVMTIAECYVRENGTIPGYVVIFDSSNLSLGHLAKCSLMTYRSFLYFIQKCSPVSIKGVYVVNSHSLAETALAFIKSVTSGNMVSKTEVFRQGALSGLYEHVPREILPEEYGGDVGTMEELHREAYEAIKRLSAFTMESDKRKVDERKRPGAKTDFRTLFGAEGSFKKLNVD